MFAQQGGISDTRRDAPLLCARTMFTRETGSQFALSLQIGRRVLVEEQREIGKRRRIKRGKTMRGNGVDSVEPPKQQPSPRARGGKVGGMACSFCLGRGFMALFAMGDVVLVSAAHARTALCGAWLGERASKLGGRGGRASEEENCRLSDDHGGRARFGFDVVGFFQRCAKISAPIEQNGMIFWWQRPHSDKGRGRSGSVLKSPNQASK